MITMIGAESMSEKKKDSELVVNDNRYEEISSLSQRVTSKVRYSK